MCRAHSGGDNLNLDFAKWYLLFDVDVFCRCEGEGVVKGAGCNVGLRVGY